MNWKLVFGLSLIGVAMAVASVFGLTGKMEPLLWLMVFAFYALVLARFAPGKYFLHGFVISVINGVWISLIHWACFDLYMRNNPGMMASYDKMPHFAGPRVMMWIVGPIIGAVTGLVAGLFALIAGRVLKKN